MQQCDTYTAILGMLTYHLVAAVRYIERSLLACLLHSDDVVVEANYRTHCTAALAYVLDVCRRRCIAPLL